MREIREAVIVSATRTPIGSYGGALADVSAPHLGSQVIKSALERASIPFDKVDKVIMGNVLSAGLGQAPARQAALYAGLPNEVNCLTINKMCGSGLKAVMLACQAVALGDADVVVAGGMESMSNAPYLLEKARFGYRMGNGELVDSMLRDGLWDVYNNVHMGNAAEQCAASYHISRADQDDFAALSYKRAIKAQEDGDFKEEITPVRVASRKGEQVIVLDEEPRKVKFDKIPVLRSAFQKDGTVTAANASSLNDGASAVVVMASEVARQMKITPLARIVGYATASKAPEWFTIAPVDATQKLLDKMGMGVDEVDLYEINEAFSVVALATKQLLNLDIDRINIRGGAVALGHPIGASGARILTTLLYNLKRNAAAAGVASICIGGGEAVSVMVKTDL